MPFVPAPGIVTVAAIFLMDNQNVENTFNYKVTGTIDRTKLAAMAATYISWANTNKGIWATNVQLLKVYLRDLTVEGGTTIETTPTTEIAGTKTGPALPNNMALALKRETGLAGRANRGRLYQFGLAESDRSDDNHYDNARASDLCVRYNTLLAAQASSNSAAEAVLHRKFGTSTPVIGYTFTDLTLDSQRRRLPDHNRHR